MRPPVHQQHGGEGAEADQADGRNPADEDGGPGPSAPPRTAAR